jgi:alkanesulfonate monooxygenase SsuD/methylene tetrahydromethanopterin reductase-like flavin-dependent oxidoreductase (luciferase family)
VTVADPQDLLFGTFLTPSSKDPQRPVVLARLSERVGLDVVTFQDHPYQPAFLDTSTLLAYVAARTERVQIAANVTNLPLRPPTVLARAAASLDLLSGGRFVLSLGAGAFWEAIEAMGGRRLTPGASVAALTEALHVIREVWDTEQPGGIRVDGEHYRVIGAKRGPAPAHPVPIWIGAYGPRMLRLIGRHADGWVVTLGRLPGAESLADLNAVIDESAVAAGRTPGAIRRLVNIAPEDATADRLALLAVRYGVSGFILASDDEATITGFGTRIAPATRRLAAAERPQR